jgi:hypothetical protein
MEIPNERRCNLLRAVSGTPAARAGRERGQKFKVHRAGAASLAAGDVTVAAASWHAQPSRSSRPHSFAASASDSFEPTCFSIAVE